MALFNSILTGKLLQLRTNLRLIMPTITVSDIYAGCYAVRYLVSMSTGNWARYVDRIRSQVRTGVN